MKSCYHSVKSEKNPLPLVILIVGLAVLGGGLVWFARRIPSSPAANVNVPETGGGETDELTVRTETFMEETPTTSVDARWPQIYGLTDIEQAELVNGDLEHLAIVTVEEFQREGRRPLPRTRSAPRAPSTSWRPWASSPRNS